MFLPMAQVNLQKTSAGFSMKPGNTILLTEQRCIMTGKYMCLILVLILYTIAGIPALSMKFLHIPPGILGME